MRPLASLLLAAGCLLGVPALADPTVTLCFERQEVLPWRTLDGHGLDFELLGEAARRTGVRFEYRAMPWKRCLAQLAANEVDGAFAASFSQERTALGAYPGGDKADPARRLHMDRYVLVRRKGSAIDWDGHEFRHVEGRIGVQLGYSVAAFLRARQLPVDEGSQKADELAQKLLAGRLEAAAFGGGDAVRLLRGPLGQQLEVLPEPLVEQAYYLMLSHGFAAANPKLAERIWDAIGAARASPAHARRERSAVQSERR
ncbi:substrate-binding periplasmic protein [Massilia terrae]|uniref:Transporter substrate-binding domain-containing protein n=1 Tax=Massilia terrae TaxID=1811224 RepID=A0ABT2D1I9_9BURK|nr:transporter substrate-binding domain-containing protein [Massilia terrae]MCS0660087.1 transporter substrate-binding domain-containing protein [Massilia terrae]